MDIKIIVMLIVFLILVYGIFFAIAITDNTDNRLIAIGSTLVSNLSLLFLFLIVNSIKNDFFISIILTLWLSLMINVLVVEVKKIKGLN